MQRPAWLTQERLRFLKFCVVGGTGVVVNEAVLWVCYRYVFTSLSTEATEALGHQLFATPGEGYGVFLAVACLAQLLPHRFWGVHTFLGGNRLTWSGITSIGVSIFTNFLLNDVWTWRDRNKGGRKRFLHRLGQYYLVATVAGFVQWGILKLLTEEFGVHYLVSNLAGIMAGLVINFVVNNLWTFRDRGGATA